MSNLYGLIATEPTRVDCALLRSQRSLILSGFGESRNIQQPTGRGIALLLEEDEIRTAHEVIHTPLDTNLDQSQIQTPASAIIAHVRHGSIGKPDLKNTHPFQHESWVFAHHGTIENFQTIRREVMGEMPPELRRAVQGGTDSEHIFHLFLSYLKRSAGSIAGDAPINRIRDSFAKTISMLNEWSERTGTKVVSRIVILATNRRALLAFRQGGPLHYVERDAVLHCPICGEPHAATADDRPYRAVAVSSEPFSGEEWKEVPEGSLMLIDPDLTVTFSPLEE